MKFLLALLLISSQAMAVTQVTDETFDKEVKQAKVPVVIDFYADWCGYCKMLEAVMEREEKRAAGKVKFVRIDVEKSVAKKFIQGLPTVALAYKGHSVRSFEGFNEKELHKLVDEALSLK
jgi:thioredoxin 1